MTARPPSWFDQAASLSAPALSEDCSTTPWGRFARPWFARACRETSSAESWLKRLLDIAVASLGLVVLAPVLVLAAVAIKLESRGPALYRQRRVGRWLRPFVVVKLRSMYHNPNDRTPRWTTPGDDRVTRVGRLLRRTRLDEVPQLWNVLRGEMSLIGPRPEQLPFAERLAHLTPRYHWRHAVRPGVTGWAQVKAGYCSTEEESLRKLEYDLFYVRHMSLLLDLEVAVRTVGVLLTGKGCR